MRLRLSVWTASGCAALVASATLLLPVAAHATTIPTWEPDQDSVGTMNFYDSSGNQVTGGSITDSPFALYAVGSVLPRAGDTKALLQYAQPNPNDITANWNVASVSAQATTFPVTGAGVPTDISSLDASHPVVTEAAIDNTLQQDIFALPNTGAAGDSFDGASGCAYETTANDPSSCTTADYENLYQLRLLTTNGSANTTTYDDADILVDPSTGDWSQVYPAPPVSTNTTTTTLTTNPSGSTSQGTTVTLTATVLGSDNSNPAGSVQFKNGGAALGVPVAVDTDTGTAQMTIATLAPGTHTLTAVFTPTDEVSYSASTSDPVSLLVNAVATTPTITGTARVGGTVICNEATSLGESASFAWKLSGKSASTGRTYKLPGTAAGKSLTCTATVNVSGGTPSSKTSTAKKVALGAALKDTKKPKLSGTGKVGKTEKVSKGSWSPSATRYSYQWYLGSAKIKGATKSSFKIAKKDKGKKLSCKVTAKKTGYAAGSAKSNSITVKKK